MIALTVLPLLPSSICVIQVDGRRTANVAVIATEIRAPDAASIRFPRFDANTESVTGLSTGI